MINRRDFLGITAGAGTAMALTPELLRALQQSSGKLIQRAIPSSGEMLPVIGLGRGNDAIDPAALKEVLKTFVDNGCRVLDTVHDTVGTGEQTAAAIANELGIQNKIFWSLRGMGSGVAGLKANVEASFARLKVPKIDVINIHVGADPTQLAFLRELKKEGRLRYIGVHAGYDHQLAQLEPLMRNEPIDFVGVRYAIDSRKVEETILPLAQERKIGVLAYFPFGGNYGPSGQMMSYLFARIGNAPLPEWAAEFDARTWGQFFLKYVISHPAVTAVRVGTSKPKNMLDNIAGGTGRLPNAATRKRMAELVDGLITRVAVRVPTSVLERYVGDYEFPPGTYAVRLQGETLTAQRVGTPVPARNLVPLSETRFKMDDAGGWEVEFVIDQTALATMVIRMGSQEIRGRRKP